MQPRKRLQQQPRKRLHSGEADEAEETLKRPKDNPPPLSLVPLLRSSTAVFPGENSSRLSTTPDVISKLRDPLLQRKQGAVLLSRPSGGGLSCLVATLLRKNRRRLLVLYPAAWAVSLRASTHPNAPIPHEDASAEVWREITSRGGTRPGRDLVLENLHAVPLSLLPLVLDTALDLSRSRLVVCTTSKPYLRPFMSKRNRFCVVALDAPRAPEVIHSLLMEFSPETPPPTPQSPLGKAVASLFKSTGNHLAHTRSLLCQAHRVGFPDRGLSHPSSLELVNSLARLSQAVPHVDATETFRQFCSGLPRRPLEELMVQLDDAPQILLSYLFSSIFQRRIPVGGPAPLRLLSDLTRSSLYGFCKAVRRGEGTAQDAQLALHNPGTLYRMGPSAPLIHLTSIFGATVSLVRSVRCLSSAPPSSPPPLSSSSQTVQNTHYRVWLLMMRLLLFWQQQLSSRVCSGPPLEALWDISFLSQWVLPWSVVGCEGARMLSPKQFPGSTMGTRFVEEYLQQQEPLSLWTQEVVVELASRTMDASRDVFSSRGAFHVSNLSSSSGRRRPRK